MPKKKRKMTLSAKRTAAIKRRFRKDSGKGFHQEKYYGRYKSSGLVPRNKKKPTQTDLAVSRHYAEYIQTRPVNPRKYLSGGKTNRLGPDTMFLVWIKGIVFASFKTSKDKKVQTIYKLLIKTLRLWYKKVADHIKIDLIGDPRTFGAGRKGLFPRGGTGYMRRLTRGFIESQIVNNRDFPFEMNIAVPVEYASYLNDTLKLQLAHSRTKAYRIVDYNAGKPKYGKISLNDPSAINGFYEETIDRARDYASKEFVRTINRFGLRHNTYLANTTMTNQKPLRIDINSFGYSPSEFENSI